MRGNKTFSLKADTATQYQKWMKKLSLFWKNTEVEERDSTENYQKEPSRDSNGRNNSSVPGQKAPTLLIPKKVAQKPNLPYKGSPSAANAEERTSGNTPNSARHPKPKSINLKPPPRKLKRTTSSEFLQAKKEEDPVEESIDIPVKKPLKKTKSNSNLKQAISKEKPKAEQKASAKNPAPRALPKKARPAKARPKQDKAKEKPTDSLAVSTDVPMDGRLEDSRKERARGPGGRRAPKRKPRAVKSDDVQENPPEEVSADEVQEKLNKAAKQHIVQNTGNFKFRIFTFWFFL